MPKLKHGDVCTFEERSYQVMDPMDACHPDREKLTCPRCKIIGALCDACMREELARLREDIRNKDIANDINTQEMDSMARELERSAAELQRLILENKRLEGEVSQWQEASGQSFVRAERAGEYMAKLEDRAEKAEREHQETNQKWIEWVDLAWRNVRALLVKAERDRDEARKLLRQWVGIYTETDTESIKYATRRLNLGIETMKFLAVDRQGGASDAPGSTPDAGHHVEPADWNPDFHTKE